MSASGKSRKTKDQLTVAERRSTVEIHRFKAELLDLLAGHFGGRATLNHLRVGNFIGLRSQYEGRPTSNLEIARALRLSRPTVSRIVSDFIRLGWVTERPHPEDGRKRLLSITPGHPHSDRFERVFRRQLYELIQRHQSGMLVMVDPERSSF